MNSVKKYQSPADVATGFALDFAAWADQLAKEQDSITVALSGGSTPKLLYKLWAEQYAGSIDWNRIHFFWGDERCVPPEDPESNFGVANELFLKQLNIASDHVHRVLGESDPESECDRYREEIKSLVRMGDDKVPKFDLIILGMGDDGHTASIFPNQSELLSSRHVCETAVHPVSGQKRITLTGNVLNAADWVAFLVTGQNKTEILSKIINQTDNFRDYPAAHVDAKQTDWYVDDAAAGRLSD